MTMLSSPMSMLRHLLPALVAATTTTALLFYLMHLLIAQDFIEPAEDPGYLIPDFVMPDTKISEFTEKVVKPEAASNPPPPQNIQEKHPPIGEVFPATGEKFVVEKIPQKFSAAASNIPLASYLVSPNYPGPALSRNIEGYVDLRFDVAASGATENIQVLAAAPQGYFEKAAVDAARRWRFQPVVNAQGNAVPYFGLTQRVRFEMQKNK